MSIPVRHAAVKILQREAFYPALPSFLTHAYIQLAHAKGILLSGTFTPTREAVKLSNAPHFTNSAGTPVIARFSNSTGLPQIPDSNPNADPRGLAVRFNLGSTADSSLTGEGRRRVHTDIICHSTPFFPVRTGEEFLAFFKAIAASPPGSPSPSPIEDFLSTHPAALAFVQAPKPPPSSFAREQYWGVTAYQLVSAAGEITHVRYQFRPDAGVETLDADALKDKEKSPNYLFDQLRGDENVSRLRANPIVFHLCAQIAGPGDVVDDATKRWPGADAGADLEGGHVVTLGTVKLDAPVPDDDDGSVQKHVIFDPVPRGVEGLRPSGDPLLEMRSAVYLISGRERRKARELVV